MQESETGVQSQRRVDRNFTAYRNRWLFSLLPNSIIIMSSSDIATFRALNSHLDPNG